ETAAFLRRLSGRDPVETHISLVFVGDDTVWKLKKSIKLSFLDFTDPETRRHLAQRELELNASAAPGLYRDVAAVIRGPDGPLALAAPDAANAIDLRMARIPEGDLLDARAAAGPLEPLILDQLADAVAAYHAHAPVADIDPVADMHSIIEGNLRAAAAARLPREPTTEWSRLVTAILETSATRLYARAGAGLVRRGHGDLHLSNICIWNGLPVPFDALEFDEALATIDVAYDLAFLLMDLDVRVSRPAANRVMNRYIARTGDAGLTALHPLFLSLRAMVLAHVRQTRGDPAGAVRYLQASLAYLAPTPPVALAIGGLQGSGKTTLARALAPELGRAPGALILRSDEIRKRRNGLAPEDRLPKSAYTEAESLAVFAELANELGQTAAGGHAVIADATFIDPAHRRMIAMAAQQAAVPFRGIWLEAPLDVLASRITARQGDASDATIAVLRAAAKSRTIPPRDWTRVDATNFDSALAAARRAVLEMQTRPAN
ncbi:MAG: AAA family ATPase, partial [Acetobacteraceae bacterium]|nr:AAA family ATPase [Acetobacteraceae bacterium]